MTKYFLKSGIPVNSMGEASELPLDYALTGIRTKMICWEPRHSIFKLIVRLTGKDMIEPFEVLKLLSDGLSNSQFSEVICRYAGEGKVVEFATLLLLLLDKHLMVDDLYVPSPDAQSGNRMTLRQYVVNRIVTLENEVSEVFASNSTKLSKLSEMKELMKSELLLLEIFLRTQDDIVQAARSSSYSSPATPQAIAVCFEVSGFKLTGQDVSYLKNASSALAIKRKEQHSAVRSPAVDCDSQLASFETVADVGLDEAELENGDLLQMRELIKRLATEAIASFWDGNQPVFKLIALLCLPEMRDALQAIALLSQNLENLNEMACFYAKEGNLVELAIILMVAREKAMHPVKLQINGDNSEMSMTLLQVINCELAQAVDLDFRFIGRETKKEKELCELYNKRKKTMISALFLLQIIEKAGDRLQAYIQSGKKMVQKEQVVKDVVKLLTGVGFELKPSDIGIGAAVERSKEVALGQRGDAIRKLKKDAEMSARRGSQEKGSGRIAYLLPCGFVQGVNGQPLDVARFLSTRYPRECSILSSGVRPFRSLWTSNAKAGYCTCTMKALNIQQRHVGVNWLLQKFPASKQLASLALVAKRVIK